MSWTDVFPVLTDEMVAGYKAGVTTEERAQYEEWLGVARVLNPRRSKHTVCFSLFWKNIHAGDPDLPKPTRKILKKAKEMGILKRAEPWNHYIQPLLDGAKKVHAARKDAHFRIYLAADMDFLAEDFTKLGCEVRVMKSPSIRHNPGALWRFLALDETDTLVTFSDSDRAPNVLSDLERTDTMSRSGLGMWRVPWLIEKPIVDNPDAKNANAYRPILGCQFGSCNAMPARMLMEALHWNTTHGHLGTECNPPGCAAQKVFGTVWPNYGYDEWFLQAAIYPRVAAGGVMTFLPANSDSRLVPVDIEYVTWANPRSEIYYFGQQGGACCAPAKRAAAMGPKLKLKSPNASPLYRGWIEQLNTRSTSRQKASPTGPVTLVVARYMEDLSWLLKVSADITVVVYNKGLKLTDKAVLGRIDSLKQLRNQGRESDTYLHHLMVREDSDPNGWTAFSQGDPFTHSPDFLKLLESHVRKFWNEVQPLTWGWAENSQIPPQSMMDNENSERLLGLRIRTQEYSAWTLHMQGFFDAGSRDMMPHYLAHNKLESGYNISGHFLERCGLTELAAEAWAASTGRFAYGAQFAVQNRRLHLIPKENLAWMKKLAREFYVNGYIFERLWLHFFGLPFVKTEANPRGLKLKSGGKL